MKKKLITILLVAFILVSCTSTATPTPQSNSTLPAITITQTPPIPTKTQPPTVTNTPRPRIKAGDELGFLKGMNYFSWVKNNYAQPLADRALEDLSETGTTWVAIVANTTQKNIDATDTDAWINSDESIIHAIQKTHDLNMNVMLKLGLGLSVDSEHWSGQIGTRFGANEWDQWFAAYTEMVLHYAQLAEANGVEMFCIGTELNTPQRQTLHFQKLITEVRSVYSGPITYASNWDAIETEWWDQVDYIGIDSYFMITKKSSPSLEELELGWDPIVTTLEALSNKWHKPIIFTEVGFVAQEYAACNFGCGKNPENSELGKLDPQTQANAYQSVFNVFRDKKWFQGTFWWDWNDNVYAGGMCDPQFTPKGKMAENVLRAEYGAAPITLIGPAPLPVFDENKIVEFSIFKDDFGAVNPTWWHIDTGIVTSPVFKGTKALKFWTDPQGGGFSALVPWLDTTPYQWLEFYIYPELPGKGRVYSEDSFHVSAANKDGAEYYFNSVAHCNYLDNQSSLQLGQWNRILIPLEEIGADKRLLQSIGLQNFTIDQAVVWLDEIRLVGLK